MTPMTIAAAVPLFNIYWVINILTGYFLGREVQFGALVKKLLVGVVTNPIISGLSPPGRSGACRAWPMPVIRSKSVHYIAITATPLALLVLGATFKGREALQKIGPTIAAGVSQAGGDSRRDFPLRHPYGLPGGVASWWRLTITLASPTTVTCYIMAKSMGGDDTLSASVVMIATLLSSVTLTLWAFVDA